MQSFADKLCYLFFFYFILHLISSFTAVIITIASLGHHLRNIKMGHNELLSQSTYTIILWSGRAAMV